MNKNIWRSAWTLFRCLQSQWILQIQSLLEWTFTKSHHRWSGYAQLHDVWNLFVPWIPLFSKTWNDRKTDFRTSKIAILTISILENQEVLKLPFSPFLGLWIWTKNLTNNSAENGWGLGRTFGGNGLWLFGRSLTQNLNDR